MKTLLPFPSLIILSLSILSLTACNSKSKFTADTNTGIGFSQTDDNTIQFGEDDVFRIGDGTSGVQSACASELKGYDLKGSTYYFQFEVFEDDTKVDLSIDKICGVDKADATFISVINDDTDVTAFAEITVATDANSDRKKSFEPFTGLQLDKGIYSLVVRSKNTVGRVGPVPAGLDEFDDFIIGKLNLKGEKKVKAIRVFAE